MKERTLLSDLGWEYLENEKTIRERIVQLRKEQKEAVGEERMILTGRINYLYSVAAQARNIGDYLVHYYDRGHQACVRK